MRPLYHASHGPPPPLRFTARGRISNLVLAMRSHPSFANDDNAKKRFAASKKGKRSAERRIVLLMTAPQTSLRSLRNSSVRGCAQNDSRARLSALTLAALATGYYPDGSAPEPGFPRRRLTGVLPASLKNAAVKHAPCGPVLVPVDRGPEAARVRIGNSARGHRTPPSLSRHAVRNGALHKAR